jgi:hypothetical protein
MIRSFSSQLIPSYAEDRVASTRRFSFRSRFRKRKPSSPLGFEKHGYPICPVGTQRALLKWAKWAEHSAVKLWETNC